MRFNPELRAKLNQVRREMIQENRILDWSTKVKQGNYTKIIEKLIDCYEELKVKEKENYSYRVKYRSLKGSLKQVSNLRIKYKAELRLLNVRYKLLKKQFTILKDRFKTNTTFGGQSRKYKTVEGKRVRI